MRTCTCRKILRDPRATSGEIEDNSIPSVIVSLAESETQNITDVLLNYNSSEPVSWVDYSLDEQANVTITGNTTIMGNMTLTGLMEGSHSLKIYVADS